MSARDRLIGQACRALGRVFSSHAVTWPAGDRSRRVLILKPCCLGDVLLSTPVVAGLRRAFPDAWLCYGVGDWARAAVRDNPHLSALVRCGVRGGERPKPAAYAATVRSLRQGRFDVCFVLDRSPLITALPFLAGIPHRVGLDSAGRGFSLTVRVPTPDGRHEAELYLDTLRSVGIDTTGLGLEFRPTRQDAEWALSQLESLPQRAPHAPRVVVHPGGGVNPGMSLLAKRWPAERYGALVRRILDAGGQVIVAGGATDAPVIRAMDGALGVTAARARIMILPTQLSLGRLGALIQQADLFVGNDTGPMHLAVAVGTPVVAIFGPSSPSMYGPYSSRARVVYRQVPCSPCFVHGGYNAACRDYRCIKAVEVDDVWRAALELVPALSGRLP